MNENINTYSISNNEAKALNEKAASYKAQADYWKEQFEGLHQQCSRIVRKSNGLKKLKDILDQVTLD